MHGGVSSFAYQGTNSHAVLATAAPAILAPAALWVWQRSRFWYQVTSHPLLQLFWGQAQLAAGTAREVLVQSNLRQAALSYVWDHSMQDTAVVPSSFFLEMASAAGHLLCFKEQASSRMAVSNAAFQQPLPCAPLMDSLVTCSLSAASGAVSVACNGPSSAMAPVHMLACLQTVPCSEASRGASKPTAAAPLLLDSKDTAGAQIVGPLLSPPQHSRQMVGQLLRFIFGAAGGSSSTAFATVLAEQHQHVGHWIHPAIADASMQLAVVLHAQAAIRSAGLLVTAALSMYTPSCHAEPARSCMATGTSAGLKGAPRDHWLVGPAVHTLTIIGHQLKSIAVLQALAASMSAPQPTTLSAQLGSEHPASSHQALVQQLSELVAELTGASRIAADQPFMEAGLDSIGKHQVQLAAEWALHMHVCLV